MTKILYIGTGGFLGSILRVFIFNFLLNDIWATLFVNIVGCFVFSLIVFCFDLKEEIRIGITTGFLGAFTVFSTICLQAEKIISNDRLIFAIFYLAIMIIGGLLVSYAGCFLGQKLRFQKGGGK